MFFDHSSTPAADESSTTDGRRKRTILTRQRIVAALTALMREGHVAPTAQDVSLRANVGLRTVFRHFDDMETLYREVDLEVQSTVASILNLELKAGHWRDRLSENIKARCRLYDTITPFLVSAQVHRHESTQIDTNLKRHVALERTILKRLLPKPLVADKARFEALLMLLSPQSWMRLRREQGLSSAAAISCVQLSAQALVA